MNADKEHVLLVGTESGKIKIYGLTNNERKGIISPHDKVIGFLAWDSNAFISAGSEGKLHVWLWKSSGINQLGMAVVSNMGTAIPGIPGTAIGGTGGISGMSGIPGMSNISGTGSIGSGMPGGPGVMGMFGGS